MKKIIFVVFILILIIGFPVFSGGKSEESSDQEDNWEKEAELGDYLPETENWDEIIEKAKKEEKVVIYSLSSRVFDFARTFYNKYGIKVEANDISTPDLLEKLRREQDAGINHADVVLVDNIPDLYNEFTAEGLLYKYYPSDLKDVTSEDALNQPLAIHHYGCRGILYNTAVNKEPPIDSWWDLTRPEWKGKIITKDPMKSGNEFNMFATFVKNSDDFAESYKEEFGEEIVLSEGCENAGYEFLKRILENDLVLMSSSDPVMKAVAGIGQEKPPVGLISLSKIRVIVDENMSADIMRDVKPVMGFKTTTCMAIAKGAQHPNAAKLLIRWMAGEHDTEKYAGYKPYYVVGNWSPRTDFSEPADQPELGDNVYIEDPDWLYKNSVKIRDFWLQYQ